MTHPQIKKAIRDEFYESHETNANKYARVHYWLCNKFGKANKCESKTCKGKSKNYHWALIRGKKYEAKRENFIQMCVSCHFIYDMTPKKREVMRKLSLGRKFSEEHKEKIRIASMGNQRGVGYKHTKEAIEAIRKSKKKIPVAQYTLDGKFVNKFPSIIEVKRQLGFQVRLALIGKYKTVGGYIWKAI